MTREALAEAASVEGITNVTPYFRQVTRPGEGMVRLDRLTRDLTGFGYMATWQVVIFLPQDLTAAEKWLDANLNTLIEAISEELVVASAIPSQMALDAGTVPALVVEGARAHD